jgi:hypothetical protein
MQVAITTELGYIQKFHSNRPMDTIGVGGGWPGIPRRRSDQCLPCIRKSLQRQWNLFNLP